MPPKKASKDGPKKDRLQTEHYLWIVNHWKADDGRNLARFLGSIEVTGGKTPIGTTTLKRAVALAMVKSMNKLPLIKQKITPEDGLSMKNR